MIDKVSQDVDEFMFMEFGQSKLPLNVWKAEYNLQLHGYRGLLSAEEYLNKALINDGLTEDEIKDIRENGKYKKDFKE